MQYKNTKTGATFSSPFVIHGGDWVLLDLTLEKTSEVKLEPITPEQSKEPTNFAGDDSYDGITKKQIMQELDAFGIEYNPKANKPELYALMMSQGE